MYVDDLNIITNRQCIDETYNHLKKRSSSPRILDHTKFCIQLAQLPTRTSVCLYRESISKIQYEQIISLQKKKPYGYLIFRNEKQTNSDHMMASVVHVPCKSHQTMMLHLQ